MITLRFLPNPAAATADVNEPQIWASEQFPEITVKSESAAWNFVRKYRDEAEEVVVGELLAVATTDGTPLKNIPAVILFKRNAKGKVEFKDYAKLLQKEEERKAKAEAKAAAKAEKNTKEKDLIDLSIQVAEELDEEVENFPDQGEEFINQDLALSKF